MANAKKLPSGSWRVQAFSHKDPVTGKRIYKSFTASTKAEAQRMAAEFMCSSREVDGNPTVMECVDSYIESKSGVLSPSTVRGYVRIKKRLAPLAGTRIQDLRSPDVQYLISDLSRTLSPKSVRNIHSLLMSSIRQAGDFHFRVTLPSRRPVEYHTPTDTDVKRLIDSAGHDLRIAILLAATGTLRRGEVCALDYSDVLYDFNAVYVHRDMVQDKDNRWIIKEMPKTSGSIRRVQLPKEVIQVIGRGDGFVYPHSPAVLTNSFTALRNRLGLKCRFHDLRHYAASVMHAIGVPDQYIMERGGWTDDRVLKEVYRNTLSDKTKQFTAMTNKYLSENITRDITRVV